MIAITKRANAVTNGCKTVFGALGGVAPYSFSVVGGGSIDSNGLYTAPATGIGTATVTITDSQNKKATAEIIYGTALEMVCDIIQTELGLPEGRVFLYDQETQLPKDKDLFVTVQVLSAKAIGNSRRLQSDGQVEQSVRMWAQLQIDFWSRSTDALYRKEEVVMALGSVYAQMQQEACGFMLAKQPTAIVNLSRQDGAAIPYRFNFTVNVQYSVRKQKAVDYFDKTQGPTVLANP